MPLNFSRRFTWTHKGEDIITLDDDPNLRKAQMHCGHKISSESMREYCSNALKNGKSTIECPAYECNARWPFSECRSVMRSAATSSSTERHEMDKKISLNYISSLGNVEPCPFCHCFLEKPRNLSSEVICPYCAANGGTGRFCWSCKKPWISGPNGKCFDPKCSGEVRSESVMILAICSEKKILKRFAPSIRACPNCGLLIHHRDKCHHVNCPSCRKYFCFFCLYCSKMEDNLCRTGSTCRIAPRQTTLSSLSR